MADAIRTLVGAAIPPEAILEMIDRERELAAAAPPQDAANPETARILNEREEAISGLASFTAVNVDPNLPPIERYQLLIQEAIRTQNQNLGDAAFSSLVGLFTSRIEELTNLLDRRLFLFIHFIIYPKRPIAKILNM